MRFNNQRNFLLKLARPVLVIFSLTGFLGITACGGGGGDNPGPGPDPVGASLMVRADKSQVTAADGQFAVVAVKSGTTLPVTWSLSAGAQGKLDAVTGDAIHYIPPAALNATSMEYITATIDYDSASTKIHLKSTVSVQVSPQKSGTTVNILQYNVKGDSKKTGGWNVDTIRNKQLEIMSNYSGALDFITLEQATLDTSGTSLPLVSDVIGKTGWSTIVSHCYQDAIQIGYDNTRWTPVNSLAVAQGRSQAVAGFGSCPAIGTNDSRPYNMVLFQRNGSKPAFQVLLVAVHMPHGSPDTISWSLTDFFNAALVVANVQSINQLKQTTNIIMVGDMNEVSNDNNYSVFSNVFGTLQATPQLPTCCSNSRTQWQFKYDRVLSNGSQVPTASIPSPPAGVRYPLGNDEEHLPIIATVKF